MHTILILSIDLFRSVIFVCGYSALNFLMVLVTIIIGIYLVFMYFSSLISFVLNLATVIGHKLWKLTTFLSYHIKLFHLHLYLESILACVTNSSVILPDSVSLHSSAHASAHLLKMICSVKSCTALAQYLHFFWGIPLLPLSSVCYDLA